MYNKVYSMKGNELKFHESNKLKRSNVRITKLYCFMY